MLKLYAVDLNQSSIKVWVDDRSQGEWVVKIAW